MKSIIRKIGTLQEKKGSFEIWITWINDLTLHLIFLMLHQFSRRHLTSYIWYHFTPSLNFRFTPGVVPFKVHPGHGHLPLPSAPPPPPLHGHIQLSGRTICLLHIYRRVSVYLLDTIQTLLTYLYHETESSEIFSNMHKISILLATFYLRAYGSCVPVAN